MADFDLGLHREFWGVVRADAAMTPIQHAAQDHRIALYTEHDCDLWEASGLLGDVMDEYLLDPDDMMQVVRLGEQMLRGGGYV